GGVYGCTDPTALNYNADATIDDGSCLYDDSVEETAVTYFTMYPNPAKEKVTITNHGSSPLVQVRIFDGMGRLVSNEQVSVANGASHVLDVSALAQGNYMLEIFGSKNIEHHSLIIQK
ncbi:MAG: T9SS type A sorting domain-containing protein, partial [Flavobacterium sp.]